MNGRLQFDDSLMTESGRDAARGAAGRLKASRRTARDALTEAAHRARSGATSLRRHIIQAPHHKETEKLRFVRSIRFMLASSSRGTFDDGRQSLDAATNAIATCLAT